MREIPLTMGLVAIVDDEDFERMSCWKWHAFKSSSGHVYAARNSSGAGGVKRRHIFMHRVIARTPDELDTDHINGNGLDNRRANLRPVDRTRNMWNRAPNRRGSSRHKGVYFHKQHGKWCAAIQVAKRRIHIGLFHSESAAAVAYALRAEAEFGEFNRST